MSQRSKRSQRANRRFEEAEDIDIDEATRPTKRRSNRGLCNKLFKMLILIYPHRLNFSP